VKKFKGDIISRAYLFLAMIAFVSAIGIGYSIVQLDQDEYKAAVRQEVEQALQLATDRISYQFFEFALIANKIEGFLEFTEKLPEKQIARVVDDLLERNPGLVALALAPDLVVTHSFPQTGNQSSIGLKYWEVPEQMTSVARAYRGRRPVVDGPLPLVQGGEGYILRYPVYVPKPDHQLDHFWGIISIVIKSDELFRGYEHDSGNVQKYSFGLRELHTSGRSHRTLRGDPALFEGQPVVREFSMLGIPLAGSRDPGRGVAVIFAQEPLSSRLHVGFCDRPCCCAAGLAQPYRQERKRSRTSRRSDRLYRRRLHRF